MRSVKAMSICSFFFFALIVFLSLISGCVRLPQKREVYRKSIDFQRSCKKMINERKLDSYVANQLGRASLSIALNIAEGSGKIITAARRTYFITARASLFEPQLFITKTKMNKRLRKSILSGSVTLHLQCDFLNRGKLK
jgi:four helix bundle protein